MKIIKKIRCLLYISIYLTSSYIHAAPSTCTYQTYKWNTKLKHAVEFKKVKHSYSRLNKNEVDATTGCTVCQEDQVEINLAYIKPFSVCKLIENDIRRTLINLIEQGELITEVTGYRVGQTRGKVDEKYNRTEFSNHSFGIALDINASQNGLYDRCFKFSSACRLIRGGVWNPNNKRSLRPQGSIVIRMKQLGFRWGGEIAGKQKDFMHFSPSGY